MNPWFYYTDLSFSEPFAVGDIYGAVEVVSYITKNGEVCSSESNTGGSSGANNDQCDTPGPDNRCTPPASFDYKTITNGSWNSPSTWQNGNVPSADPALNLKSNLSLRLIGK